LLYVVAGIERDDIKVAGVVDYWWKKGIIS